MAGTPRRLRGLLAAFLALAPAAAFGLCETDAKDEARLPSFEALCPEPGLVAERWGEGCRPGFWFYLVQAAASDRPLTPSLKRPGKPLHKILTDCGEDAECREAWASKTPDLQLEDLWTKSTAEAGWSLAERRSLVSGVLELYQRDLRAVSRVESDYQAALLACRGFKSSGSNEDASAFFGAVRHFRVSYAALDHETVEWLDHSAKRSPEDLAEDWNKKLAAWEESMRSALLGREGKQEQLAQDSKLGASLGAQQAAAQSAGSSELGHLMDGSSGSLVDTKARAVDLSAPLAVKPEEAEKDARLHALWTQDFAERMRETSVGSRLLKLTPAPPLRLSADESDAVAWHDSRDGSITVSVARVASVIRSRVPSARSDASLDTAAGLRDYLLANPEARTLAADHLDVTYVHERTHALQNQVLPAMAGMPLGRKQSVDDEHEAFVAQNRYLLERAQKDPKRLAYAAELGGDDIHAFTRFVRDRREFKDWIQSEHYKNLKPAVEMAADERNEAARAKEAVQKLKAEAEGCGKGLSSALGLIDSACGEKGKRALEEAQAEASRAETRAAYWEASRRRHAAREAEEARAAAEEALQGRIVLAAHLSSRRGPHSEALDWLREAAVNAPPGALLRPSVADKMRPILKEERERLEGLAGGALYEGASLRPAWRSLPLLTDVSRRLTGEELYEEDPKVTALRVKLRERYAAQLEKVCAGTHYFGEWGPYAGALVPVERGKAGLADPKTEAALSRQACAERKAL